MSIRRIQFLRLGAAEKCLPVCAWRFIKFELDRRGIEFPGAGRVRTSVELKGPRRILEEPGRRGAGGAGSGDGSRTREAIHRLRFRKLLRAFGPARLSPGRTIADIGSLWSKIIWIIRGSGGFFFPLTSWLLPVARGCYRGSTGNHCERFRTGNASRAGSFFVLWSCRCGAKSVKGGTVKGLSAYLFRCDPVRSDVVCFVPVLRLQDFQIWSCLLSSRLSIFTRSGDFKASRFPNLKFSRHKGFKISRFEVIYCL